MFPSNALTSQGFISAAKGLAFEPPSAPAPAAAGVEPDCCCGFVGSIVGGVFWVMEERRFWRSCGLYIRFGLGKGNCGWFCD